MAKVDVVGGVRTSGTSSPRAESDPRPAPKFRYEYQSRPNYPALLLSLKERILHWTANGQRDERPKTRAGTFLDMVRFKDCYLGSDDKELADILEKHPHFGLPADGGRFWRKSDMDRLVKSARADEIRRELAADPELLKAALRPGDGDDFGLPPVS